MSGYAYQWAKRQHVGDSSAKTLLKTYAHWAAEDYSTWVTNDELMLDTELNIQTIRKARTKLIELGFLVETDRRLGETRSIVVYQIVAPAGSIVVQAVDQRSGDAISLSPPTIEEYSRQGEKQSRSKSRPSKGVEISSGSKSQEARNPTLSPSKSHAKGDEISSQEGRNLEGKKAVEEQEKNGEQQNARHAPRVALHAEIRSIELPDWLPADAWADWCEHREAKAKDAPWTMAAAKVSIKRLRKLLDAGQAVVAVVDEAVLRGWTGLFPVKGDLVAAGSTAALPSDWHKTSGGVTERGKQLGMTQRDGEVFMHFKARVVKAAGPGEWMEAMLADTARFGDEQYESLYRYFNDIPREQVAQTEAA
ncbi:helix-turn-helix domain-containing protein [Burkholderia vietnamiensis]|uniref:helix-turn-helix domain-containing protein n=1 Tax=Burkholderia vietnamiensis TaxID=60552 RepID=UPI001D15224A|nr:helix-turn-helix domain-containing protein [Burkholderia vietnamiensis]UEC03947.1 helix-turn-helix domain-containing protein [Burkholderia vietnamiensis]